MLCNIPLERQEARELKSIYVGPLIPFSRKPETVPRTVAIGVAHARMSLFKWSVCHMTRRVFGLLLFFLVSVAAGARSAIALEFSYSRETNIVSAHGEIETASVDAFREFLKRYNRLGAPWDVVLKLDSNGGSLAAALEIGRLIRAHQITVLVSEKCLSACVFVLMGGVQRYHERGSRVGVHQFYSDRILQNLDKKEFTGGEQIRQQMLLGQLLSFASEMGVDSALIGLASRTLPINMHILSEQELITYGLSRVLDEPTLLSGIKNPTTQAPKDIHQSLSGIRLGDRFSKLETIGVIPSRSERTGPFRITKFTLLDGNSLSVTVNVNSDAVVYIESNWGGKAAGQQSDVEGLLFGRATPVNVAQRMDGFGVYFRERGVISKITDGFLVAMGQPIADGYRVFLFRIPLASAQVAGRGSASAAAQLIGIVLGQRDYLQSIWGAEVGPIDAVFHGLIPDPVKKPIMGTRSRNDLDRYLLAKSTAATVNAAFNKVYRDGGMIQVRISIEECYRRAKKIKTERSAAYCHMLDTLGSTVASLAQRTYGFPVDDYHKPSATIRRNEALMALMKFTHEDKKDLAELWSAMIFSAVTKQ